MTGECVWFEGIPFPSREFPSGHLREVQENFLIKDEDVLLLTYPKSVVFGSWFDHTRGWMSMRDKENFLILSYEEMKWDTRSAVEKICQFLGKKLEPEELDSVLRNSSFQAMKENNMSSSSLLKGQYLEENGELLRKGVTGDWKNYFTVAQAETFDKLFQEKMADLPQDLFPWK
ncbi:unnamed protein product [Rangifer tarandus platyrhynchus]|uniref:Sulfotransferase n=2 Tax=Rangifer tarandus platyrhynchus TaxID=3082113 RepID=A0ABN8YIH3_RANTA|nr:unnamed protein product [Rangifer tarandus platyrhynchus]